jgi:hypothetical protein
MPRYYTRVLSTSSPLVDYIRWEIWGRLTSDNPLSVSEAVSEVEAQLKQDFDAGLIEVTPRLPSSLQWWLQRLPGESLAADRFEIVTANGSVDAEDFRYCRWIETPLPGPDYGKERWETLMNEPVSMESMLAEIASVKKAAPKIKPVTASKSPKVQEKQKAAARRKPAAKTRRDARISQVMGLLAHKPNLKHAEIREKQKGKTDCFTECKAKISDLTFREFLEGLKAERKRRRAQKQK